ncbi:MAG: R2-like ligand-binding oxidase [Chloroflexota bacterium]
MIRETMITTTRGLDRKAPPLRLFEKAKKFGIWNPSELDFSQDIIDWQNLGGEERELLLRLTALFQAGEEAVTLDLLPLIMAIAKEGRLEEEMFLTTFLFEEAKHTDFFNRFLVEIAQNSGGISHFHSDNYKLLFYQALPEALQALETDSSPAAQVRASVTYNMIVEGVMAETGYYAYFNVLDQNEIMPGVRKGIYLLKQDESRHIAYGIYLLSRLISEDASLWEVAQNTMNQLLPLGLGIISDVFSAYDPMPFGLKETDFSNYAVSQFSKRLTRVEKARGTVLEDINRVTHKIIENNDG